MLGLRFGRALTGAALTAGALAAAASCGARSELDVGADHGHGGSGGAASASSSPASSSMSSAESSSSIVSSSSSSTVASSTVASSSTGPACHTDADCDDGVKCTVDTCQPTGCVHQPDDAACDDGVFCTRDRCDPIEGCKHKHDDSICDDGIACTIDACDTTTDACRHDACDSMCDDGNFCNGVERCDTVFGCAMGQPACELGLGCNDTCNENQQTCHHPASCTPSGPTLVAITASGALVSVDPFTGTTTQIASGNATYFDIAILGNRWFAIDPAPALIELKPNTLHIKHSLPAPNANSLGAGPDGMLYAASNDVYRIDPDSGAFTVVASLPAGYTSSGDIAFLDGRMFVSADGPCGGALIEVDAASGTTDILGGDGLGCVYGLAATSDTLFIINCDGKIGTFDPNTGDAHVLSTSNLQVYGADVLP